MSDISKAPKGYVSVEHLCCPQHGFHALSVNDTRVTEGKCCGSWRVARRWLVSAAELTAAMKEGES